MKYVEDFTLETGAPYDWEAMLMFFAARAIPGVEHVADGTYRRSFSTGRGHGVITVKPAGSGKLHVVVRSTSAIDVERVTARLRRLFDLDAPHKHIVKQLRRDERFHPHMKRRPGLRVPGAWDPFELGVRAILGQQVSVAAASTLTGRIATRFGKLMRHPHERLTHLFPEPQVLATADLAGIGLTTRRAATVTGFAQAVAEDRHLLDATKPLDQFARDLAALQGFGPWTAHYMAMRLGYHDAFPTSDLGLRKALGSTADREVNKLAEAWRPYRAYAAMHLWASLSDA